MVQATVDYRTLVAMSTSIPNESSAMHLLAIAYLLIIVYLLVTILLLLLILVPESDIGRKSACTFKSTFKIRIFKSWID
jgi:hypothetical protein